jgi:hypothetical protein
MAKASARSVPDGSGGPDPAILNCIVDSLAAAPAAGLQRELDCRLKSCLNPASSIGSQRPGNVSRNIVDLVIRGC